jgi:hypothetical protein
MTRFSIRVAYEERSRLGFLREFGAHGGNDVSVASTPTCPQANRHARSARYACAVPGKAGSRWWEVLGAAMPATLGIIANAVGALHVGRAWLVMAFTTLGVAGAFVGRAMEKRNFEASSRNALAGACVSLVIFISGVGAYHQWFSPQSQGVVEFVVNGPDSNCIAAFASPAWEDGFHRRPFCGGETFAAECIVHLIDGTTWFKIGGSPFWVSGGDVRLSSKSRSRDLAECRNYRQP